MREEAEELIALAEECREWMREEDKLARDKVNRVDPFTIANEFKRLADKLDAIANALAAKET
jgi:hypothetical protein